MTDGYQALLTVVLTGYEHRRRKSRHGMGL